MVDPMTRTTVTVVIPAYNEQANLARLVRQTLAEPWGAPMTLDRLLIVDDCSHDGTQAMTDDLARAHERVRVIRHGLRGGKNAAMRTGLSVCASDVIVFVDADVALAPGCLTGMVGLLLKDTTLAGASCINEPLPARSWRERPSRFQALLIAALRRRGHGSLARVYALRRSAIEGLNLPDNIYDDLYIMRWLRNHGLRYGVCAEAIVSIRSATGLRDFAKQTVRAWRAEAALDSILPREAAASEPLVSKLTIVRAVAGSALREPVGFLLYLLWRTIIMATPGRLWLPVVDHSRYDTSLSTKDVSV